MVSSDFNKKASMPTLGVEDLYHVIIASDVMYRPTSLDLSRRIVVFECFGLICNTLDVAFKHLKSVHIQFI